MAIEVAPHPLPARIAEVVVESIQDAYRENQQVQARELGHGEWNYSLDVYTTIKHFLRDRLEGEGIVVEDGNTLRLEHAGYCYYIHKLGRLETDDPWDSFPNHPGPAGHAAQLQLAFDIVVETAQPRVWVVGHYGNLDDGACAVRLQASGTADAGKIRSWVQVHELWVRMDDSVLDAAAVDAAPPVEVEEPAVELKGQPQRSDAEA